MDYIVDTEYFDVKITNKIAVIHLKNNVYELVTHLNESERLMEIIRDSEYDENIDALLVLNEENCFGEKMYDDFINKIIEQRSLEEQQAPTFTEKVLRFREINILNKMVMGLAEYQKLLYFGLRGDVVTPFFGTSLTADFRFATDNCKFVLAHNKFGLHPTAALPFFLAQKLGHSQAMEIVLGKEISGEEAMGLGLLNNLLPAEDFEKECINLILSQYNCKACTVRRTKQLVNFSRRDLKEYFKYEASLLNY